VNNLVTLSPVFQSHLSLHVTQSYSLIHLTHRVHVYSGDILKLGKLTIERARPSEAVAFKQGR